MQDKNAGLYPDKTKCLLIMCHLLFVQCKPQMKMKTCLDFRLNCSVVNEQTAV